MFSLFKMEGVDGVKLGSWSFDDSPTKKGKKKGTKTEQEDERLQNEDNQNMLDAIPNIEDLQEEELTMQIAAPPSITASKISTYKHLDKDLQRHAGLFTTEDGIDLSLLATALSPEGDLQEDDKLWTFDTLFTEMSSDIESIWLNATPDQRNAV